MCAPDGYPVRSRPQAESVVTRFCRRWGLVSPKGELCVFWSRAPPTTKEDGGEGGDPGVKVKLETCMQTWAQKDGILLLLCSNLASFFCNAAS